MHEYENKGECPSPDSLAVERGFEANGSELAKRLAGIGAWFSGAAMGWPGARARRGVEAKFIS